MQTHGSVANLPVHKWMMLTAMVVCNDGEVMQVKSVEDILAEGDEVNVKCLGRDARGHVKVSRRALLRAPEEDRQSRLSSTLGMAARS